MEESDSSGNDRISPIRFFAKTVLPAPMNVIFLRVVLIGLEFTLTISRIYSSSKLSTTTIPEPRVKRSAIRLVGPHPGLSFEYVGLQ